MRLSYNNRYIKWQAKGKKKKWLTLLNTNSMANDFKIGDVVNLKSSGNIRMTVTYVSGEIIAVIYFNKITELFVKIEYPADCFTKVTSNEN